MISLTIDEDRNEESFGFLTRANNISEWIWKLEFLFGIKGFCVNMILACLSSVLLCFYSYRAFIKQNLFLPFRIVWVLFFLNRSQSMEHKLKIDTEKNILFILNRLPWNQQTAYGYFWEICFSILASLHFLISNAAVLIFFISMCLHHRAFYQIFQQSVGKLEYCDKYRNDSKFICELVRYFVLVKEYVRLFIIIYWNVS